MGYNQPGGFVIGKTLNLGYPGNVSRLADSIIVNRPVQNTDTNGIPFGAAVVLNPNDTYSLFTTTSTTLSAALASGSPYTSLSVAALTGPVLVGDSILIGTGGTTQTVTASATAAIGATAISVNSFTANAAYAIGVAVAASNTFAQFAGIAIREVLNATTYFPDQLGVYQPGQPCDVLERGSATVTCNVGTPTAGGPVYIRTALNGSIPAGVIGGFEAAADGANTIQVTNAQWKTGRIDANNTAELALLIKNKA